jgi:hypothetical protein
MNKAKNINYPNNLPTTYPFGRWFYWRVFIITIVGFGIWGVNKFWVEPQRNPSSQRFVIKKFKAQKISCLQMHLAMMKTVTAKLQS